MGRAHQSICLREETAKVDALRREEQGCKGWAPAAHLGATPGTATVLSYHFPDGIQAS